VLSYLRQGRADGAVVVSTHPEDPLPALLAGAHLPAVLFARPATRGAAELRRSRPPGRRTARRRTPAGSRLPYTGHHLRPLDVAAGQERLAGFRDALARHGHPYAPAAEGGFTRDSGLTAMARLLVDHPDIDGVFAANDLMAQGACQLSCGNEARGSPKTSPWSASTTPAPP
jgi:DNA-binding LacI/PurR family transcriptional regulator